MSQPAIMMIIKGLTTDLEPAEVERRYKERLPQFLQVDGLLQKYYAYDEQKNEWGGVYVWESKDAMNAYLASELRETIASAYELTSPPQVEILPLVDTLR